MRNQLSVSQLKSAYQLKPQAIFHDSQPQVRKWDLWSKTLLFDLIMRWVVKVSLSKLVRYGNKTELQNTLFIRYMLIHRRPLDTDDRYVAVGYF